MQKLDHLLTAWKTTLADAGALSPVEIDELESHLLDSIDDLQSIGLTPEESFLIAQRRLGQADQLGAEFEKANPQLRVQRVLLWMLCGIFSFLIVLQSLCAFADFTAWALVPLLGSIYGPVAGLVLMSLVLIVGLVVIRRWLSPGGDSRRLTRLFQRAARLHPGTMMAALLITMGLGTVARWGKSNAMMRHYDQHGYTLLGVADLILGLLVLLGIPLLIHALRKTQSGGQTASVQN